MSPSCRHKATPLISAAALDCDLDLLTGDTWRVPPQSGGPRHVSSPSPSGILSPGHHLRGRESTPGDSPPPIPGWHGMGSPRRLYNTGRKLQGILYGRFPLFRLLLGKCLRVITVLIGVTLITFLLIHSTPGNPWSNYSSSPRMMLGLGIDEPMKRELYRRFGLDLPLWRQYTRYIIGDVDKDGDYFCGVICGNLGPSIQHRGRSVQDVLFQPPEGRAIWESRFGYSVRMLLFGSLIAAGAGIPLGIRIAMRPYSASSRTLSIGLAALISIPNFVLGLLAIIVLASWLKIMRVLPDWDNPGDWIIPAVVVAAMPMVSVARVTCSSLMDILNADYVRTARAKGLSQARVVIVHVMRNALVPIITFLGPASVEMLTGLLIVENLYALPGLGRGYWAAVLQLDYPMIMGLTLVYATGIVVVNAVIELLCEILDPRIRAIKQQGPP